MRSYSAAVQDQIEKRMREIVDGVTSAGGGSYELRYDRMTPATINDIALTRQVVPSLQSVVGKENVLEIPPTMGGEDFAEFANAAPGFYFRLGMVKPGTTSGGHHTPTFRTDDSSIPIGIRAISYVAWDYLNRSLTP